MELFAVVAAAVMFLVPGVRALLDSVAYRNRARGMAEIIRAERGAGDERGGTGGRGGVPSTRRREKKAQADG
ncbi:hypothetical protein ABZ953_35805 [Streptomyces sp. NPDC046465]|uniref:hypothetical protein n=1 Tax=Streptomyces sp. NPDC046465 TaxID=3155810 RepID=UPI0033E16BDB